MAGWQQKQSWNWTSAKLHVWVTEATIFNPPQNPLGKQKFPTVPFTAHQSGRRGAGAWLSGVSATLNMERIWSSCLGQEGPTQPGHFLHINDYDSQSNIIIHSCIKAFHLFHMFYSSPDLETFQCGGGLQHSSKLEISYRRGQNQDQRHNWTHTHV